MPLEAKVIQSARHVKQQTHFATRPLTFRVEQRTAELFVIGLLLPSTCATNEWSFITFFFN